MTNEQLSAIIRKLRGNLSLRAFASKCGVSHTTIDTLEKGVDFRTGKPTQIKLATLAKIFGACNIPEDMAYIAVSSDNESVVELLEAAARGDLYGMRDGDEDIQRFGIPPTPQCARPIARKRLPMLGNVACGEPTFAEEEHDAYVDADGGVDADFCLVAKGDSMINARIFDGDILFVKQQESVDDGEIAVVLIEDETTVKRVYYDRENNVITLVPENPMHRPMRFEGARLEQIRILGKVVSGQYIVR